uniref:Reverse transcriptase domain-containing protein n=1 Tax=Denticeps clupeoides TaxID=299321 RepID=A0AAY4CQ65_9TELE
MQNGKSPGPDGFPIEFYKVFFSQADPSFKQTFRGNSLPKETALKEERITGVTRFNKTHKVSLYADDLLIYLSNPLESIPVLMELLQSYSLISGYKLNFSKSTILQVNQLAMSLDLSSSPFKQVVEFTYLGINGGGWILVNSCYLFVVEKLKITNKA